MTRFLVIIEKTATGYSAYSPDLSGCVATGSTQEETALNMHAAITIHVQGLKEDNQPVPPSSSFAEFIAVAV